MAICKTIMKSGYVKKRVHNREEGGCEKRGEVAHLLHCQEQCQRSLRMSSLLESF